MCFYHLGSFDGFCYMMEPQVNSPGTVSCLDSTKAWIHYGGKKQLQYNLLSALKAHKVFMGCFSRNLPEGSFYQPALFEIITKFWKVNVNSCVFYHDHLPLRQHEELVRQDKQSESQILQLAAVKEPQWKTIQEESNLQLRTHDGNEAAKFVSCFHLWTDSYFLLTSDVFSSS